MAKSKTKHAPKGVEPEAAQDDDAVWTEADEAAWWDDATPIADDDVSDDDGDELVNDGITDNAAAAAPVIKGTLTHSEAARQAGVPHGQFISDPALDPAQQPQPEDTEEPDALNPEKQPQPRAPLHALGARPAMSNRGLPESSRPEPDGPFVAEPKHKAKK